MDPPQKSHAGSVQVAETARRKPGIDSRRYQYGAKLGSKTGVDCSVCTQEVAASNGYKIPRTSREQAQAFQKSGQWTTKFNQVQEGNLVFFGKNGNISHTGIAVLGSNGKLGVVHSYGKEGSPESIKQGNL